ncbi:MAG: DNA-directed polymerase specialized sigma subunit [Oscillospiraceae bacterium]|nr:DNA-directed polymerase specialized sigma subunit [Oscillospiraceae bacterium]
MTNEEMALAIQQGDKSQIEPLWEQLKRLIGMYAGRYFNYRGAQCAAAGVTEEDLSQTGFFALLDAVQAYDAASGYKLTTFLRYPLKNRFNALLGLRTAKKRNDPLNGCDSMDEPLSGEHADFTRSDIMPDEKAQQAFAGIVESEWRQQLRAVEEEVISEYLTESQAVAVRGEFFEGLKLQLIADRLGVTCERARQLRQNGLRRLWSGRALRKLYPFLNDEYGALGLRGTGLSAFNYGGSATERAVETMEQRRAQTEERLRQVKAERDKLQQYLAERKLARLNLEPLTSPCQLMNG